MNIFSQVKLFISGIYKLSTGRYFRPIVRLHLVINLCSYSIKTFFIRYLGAEYTTEKLLNYTLAVDYYPDFVSQFFEIFVEGIYFCKIYSKKPKIIDCGANIGMPILFFKYFYPNSIITAFEPDKNAFSILEMNIKSNKIKNVKLINAAVYTKNGLISFNTVYDNNQTRTVGSSIYVNSKNTVISTIPIVKLKEYINKEIDILKMDIEGAESKVITSLGEKLNLIKNIVLEFHAYNHLRNKNRLSSMLRTLEDNSFIYKIQEANGQVNQTKKDHLLIISAERSNLL